MPRGVNIYDEAKIQGRLWTPNLVSPALWLDASDASTITIATGVSEWRDKSGNNRHATQTAPSQQPAYVLGAINNLNAIRFDGANDFLAHTFNASPAPHTVFAVANRRSGGDASYQSIITAISPFNAFGVNLSIKAASIEQWGSYINSWQSGEAIIGSSAAIIGIVSPTSTSGTELYRTNGTQTAAVSYASRYAGDLGNRRGIGGESSFNTGWFSGDIAEIFVFTSALSTSNCQLIEGYLGWKWGAMLDVLHPFRNRPPLIGD